MPTIIGVGRGALYKLTDLFADEAHTGVAHLQSRAWQMAARGWPAVGLGANSDFIVSFAPSCCFDTVLCISLVSSSPPPSKSCFLILGIAL